LSFNFSPNGADANSYGTFQTGATLTSITGANGGTIQESAPNTPLYGPSSGHPSIVNHLMGDASVHSLNKQMDVAAYTFLITRNGGDPNPTMP
jgi:hypothetical protein